MHLLADKQAATNAIILHEECRMMREANTPEERALARASWLVERRMPHGWRPLAVKMIATIREARQLLGRKRVKHIRKAVRAVGIFSCKHDRVLH